MTLNGSNSLWKAIKTLSPPWWKNTKHKSMRLPGKNRRFSHRPRNYARCLPHRVSETRNANTPQPVCRMALCHYQPTLRRMVPKERPRTFNANAGRDRSRGTCRKEVTDEIYYHCSNTFSPPHLLCMGRNICENLR